MTDKSVITAGFEFLKEDIVRLEAYLLEYTNSFDGILHESVKSTLIFGGKRIRPALFLICARNENYNIDYLLPAAASIEIIHTASLIHDDIIDKSILRRGRKTIHNTYDKDTAKFVGDYLFTHTFSLLNNYENRKILEEMSYAAQNLVKGEFGQLKTKRNLNQSEEVYFEKIKEKTASLFKTSCILGGMLSKSSQKDIDNMRDFGEYVGISFQINDDLIDIDLGNSAIKVGKPVGNDLKQGDITLPLIYALKNNRFKKIAESILCQDNINDDDIKIVFEMLMQTGAIETARNKFSFYLEKAAEIVNLIEGEERRKGLARVVESIRQGTGILI
ncbi:MAG: polyprenyl synthetase family protein [Actinobacteria bacterium]|nr:polyprenyl synthetase family protein [Actinomycetota bacterium]